MPELPEVENLRRGLEKALRGRQIRKIRVTKPKLVSGKGNIRAASLRKAAEFVHKLSGDTILGVERLAKNLIFNMKSGAVVVAHLKMSGQFAYQDGGKRPLTGGHPIEISERELPNKHTHIVFSLDRGVLYYNDTRMFGYVLWYTSADAARAAHFTEKRVEPLSSAFTLKYFREALAQSSSMLKTALMGQSIVSGLGNIYVDEVCFAACVRPNRRAKSLKPREVAQLHEAIRRILTRAIKLGGSSVSTYRLLDLTRGNYAREHKVYGRAGKPCVKCKKPLSKMVVQSRTTVCCKSCQA